MVAAVGEVPFSLEAQLLGDQEEEEWVHRESKGWQSNEMVIIIVTLYICIKLFKKFKDP